MARLNTGAVAARASCQELLSPLGIPLTREAQHPSAAPEEHDARTDEVIGRINRSGEAMFGGVTWNGRRVMRVSVVNWRTTPADVDRTVAAVAGAIADDALAVQES